MANLAKQGAALSVIKAQFAGADRPKHNHWPSYLGPRAGRKGRDVALVGRVDDPIDKRRELIQRSGFLGLIGVVGRARVRRGRGERLAPALGRPGIGFSRSAGTRLPATP